MSALLSSSHSTVKQALDAPVFVSVPVPSRSPFQLHSFHHPPSHPAMPVRTTASSALLVVSWLAVLTSADRSIKITNSCDSTIWPGITNYLDLTYTGQSPCVSFELPAPLVRAVRSGLCADADRALNRGSRVGGCAWHVQDGLSPVDLERPCL